MLELKITAAPSPTFSDILRSECGRLRSKLLTDLHFELYCVSFFFILLQIWPLEHQVNESIELMEK